MNLNRKTKWAIGVGTGLAIIFTLASGIRFLREITGFYPWAVKISKLETESPVEKYAKATKNNQIYFLGVYGEGLDIPGIDQMKISEIKKYPIEIIDSTGCLIKSREHQHFKQVAFNYAKEFNAKMLANLEKNSN